MARKHTGKKEEVRVETRTQEFKVMDHNARELTRVTAANVQEALFFARQDPIVRLAAQKSNGLWVLPIRD